MAKIVKKILKQAVFEADGITVAHQAGELFDEDADLDPTWVTDYAIVDEPGLVVAPEKKAEQPEPASVQVAAEPARSTARGKGPS